MVTSVTSFGRSGLSDWLLQRVTAVIVAAYTLFMVVYLVANPGLDYPQWVQLHQSNWMRFFSLFTILSIAIHAWIGLWSVLTDYVTVRTMGPKATALRLFLELVMIAALLVYVVWAIDILWGL